MNTQQCSLCGRQSGQLWTYQNEKLHIGHLCEKCIEEHDAPKARGVRVWYRFNEHPSAVGVIDHAFPLSDFLLNAVAAAIRFESFGERQTERRVIRAEDLAWYAKRSKRLTAWAIRRWGIQALLAASEVEMRPRVMRKPQTHRKPTSARNET